MSTSDENSPASWPPEGFWDKFSLVWKPYELRFTLRERLSWVLRRGWWILLLAIFTSLWQIIYVLAPRG